jgi:hypothetical protein
LSPVAAGLIAAVLLPVSRAVIPNPIWARWYWTNGRTPMPPALTRRSQRVELVIPFASLAVVALGLGILLDASDVTIETLIHLHPGRAIVWGTAAGLGWLAPYAVLWRTAKPGAGRFAQRWERGVSWARSRGRRRRQRQRPVRAKPAIFRLVLNRRGRRRCAVPTFPLRVMRCMPGCPCH